MATTKYVYFFGDGKAEGKATMKESLGGKGANLAEMTNLGIPVPPGFTISTEVCAAYYENDRAYPDGLAREVEDHLVRLEKLMGKKLGDADDPLLVSVRSGAAVSMPGMMDTILNLGMNDKAVEGLTRKTGNPRFAWDSYRRFIQMYGDVVMNVPHEEFERVLSEAKKAKKAALDTGLDTADLKKVVEQYKKVYKAHTRKDFPQNPLDQLWGAVNAVFGSWMNERAIKYRELYAIKGLKGTAVNVQSMVFGNMGDDSGTGVCFSRDPSTGQNVFYGEFLMNAQGEDVVAGIRTPEKIDRLAKKDPAIYKQLVGIKDKLEQHFHDMQDMEFTVQQGKLFLLQTRNGKRTGQAAVKMAVDMVGEKLISKEEAVKRVSPDAIDQMLHPMLEPKALKAAKSLGKGLNASPGAACGQIVFTAKDAEKWAEEGKKVLLVRKETSPEDIGGMAVAEGILTSTGGMTSHAAVVARQMGTPCVSGAKDVTIIGKTMTVGGRKFKEGDFATIDGSTGCIYPDKLPLISPKISKELETFLGWCDEIRAGSNRDGIKGFDVRANADQPDQAALAFSFGAAGVGLCRTEHMFFDKAKLMDFRVMILADTAEARKAALKKILPLQKKDFLGIFKAMNGKPVTIRLLDPPRHHVSRDLQRAGGGHRPGRGGMRQEEYPREARDHDPHRLRRAGDQGAPRLLRGDREARPGQGRREDGHTDRNHDRGPARGPPLLQDRAVRGLLFLRDQRPHPDDLRLLARRHRVLPPLLPLPEPPRCRSLQDGRRGGRRDPHQHGGQAGPRGEEGTQVRDLRRAGRRSRHHRILLPRRPQLRELLPLPRAHRSARGRAGRAQEFQVIADR